MVQNPEAAKYSKKDMETQIADLGYGKWFSDKVPFGYSYITGRNEVLNGAEIHGYHVSDICAANGDETNGGTAGVAPDAQIFAMQVYDPVYGAGGYADDLICAIEDAVLLGADVINMSLGMDSGFAECGLPNACLCDWLLGWAGAAASDGNWRDGVPLPVLPPDFWAFGYAAPGGWVRSLGDWDEEAIVDASTLSEESVITDSDGVRELPDGGPMDVKIALQSGNETYQRIAEILTNHLAEGAFWYPWMRKPSPTATILRSSGTMVPMKSTLARPPRAVLSGPVL